MALYIKPARLLSLLTRPRLPIRPPTLSLFRHFNLMSPTKRMLPECWGHRGVSDSLPRRPPFVLTRVQASASFPENTLASFEAAMRDGAEGIESGISEHAVSCVQTVTP